MERELAGQYCFFCWFCLCLTSTVLAWSHCVAGKIVGGTSLSPSFKFFTPPKGGSFMDEWESRVDEWESRVENHCINCEYQGMMRQWHGICKSSRCLKAGHMIVHAQQMLHNKTFHYFLILLSFSWCWGQWITSYGLAWWSPKAEHLCRSWRAMGGQVCACLGMSWPGMLSWSFDWKEYPCKSGWLMDI